MEESDPLEESDRLIALSHIDGLGLLPRLKKALTSAVDEARARAHGFLGTEHILLGILDQRDAVATKVLQELGVADAARDRLIEVMAAPGYLPPSPEVADPELRRELLRRRDVDQTPRRWGRMGGPHETGGAAVVEAFIGLVHAIARENAEWLKGVLRAGTWPGRSLVGQDGSGAAWLIAQHADHDPAFQRECLELLEEVVARGDASQGNLAYLTDRVLLRECGRQRYGTQFTHGAGGPEPLPLEDPERVDELRANVGLPPLSEYAKAFLRPP